MTARHVVGVQPFTSYEPDRPFSWAFMPFDAWVSVPRPIRIWMPPETTDTPTIRAASTVGGGGFLGSVVGGFGGRGGRGPVGGGGLYLPGGASSWIGTCARSGGNSAFSGKSVFTSAGFVGLNVARRMKSAVSMRPCR